MIKLPQTPKRILKILKKKEMDVFVATNTVIGRLTKKNKWRKE